MGRDFISEVVGDGWWRGMNVTGPNYDDSREFGTSTSSFQASKIMR